MKNVTLRDGLFRYPGVSDDIVQTRPAATRDWQDDMTLEDAEQNSIDMPDMMQNWSGD